MKKIVILTGSSGNLGSMISERMKIATKIRSTGAGEYEKIMGQLELQRKIDEHLLVYGDKYEERLTGAHETCSYRDY